MFNVTAIDHVGVRVTARDRAVAFYEKLGFRIDPDEESPAHKATGMTNDSGARIHLIYNGIDYNHGKNPLMDQVVKWPGYTHVALIVDSMDRLIYWLGKEGIPITEGPETVGKGRRTLCFIRDPDGNVVEFNEIQK